MKSPGRNEVVNVDLVKRRFNYVETLVPWTHFNERRPKDETIDSVNRIVYAFSADDNLRVYVATLQYFLLREGLASWKPPPPPVPSVEWAIARKRCALMRTDLPITQTERVAFANGDGALYYTPLGGSLEGQHAVFIFSSDPVTILPRVELRLKFSETPLCPEIWRTLIMRVIAGTFILE